MPKVINEGLSEFAKFSIEPRVESIIEVSACDGRPDEVIKSRLANLMQWADQIEKEVCEDRMAAELS